MAATAGTIQPSVTLLWTHVKHHYYSVWIWGSTFFQMESFWSLIVWSYMTSSVLWLVQGMKLCYKNASPHNPTWPAWHNLLVYPIFRFEFSKIFRSLIPSAVNQRCMHNSCAGPGLKWLLLRTWGHNRSLWHSEPGSSQFPTCVFLWLLSILSS